MPLRVYLPTLFDNTAEREIFDKIVKILTHDYDNNEESPVLIGNFSCMGKDIDAVLFSENGDWKTDDIIIKGGAGGKNPYKQVKDNKFALINSFETSPIPLQNINLGHITGLVLFHQSIQFDDNMINYPIKSWFHIIDINQLSLKINQITSPQINFSCDNLKNLPQVFNLTNREYNPPVNYEPVEPKQGDADQMVTDTPLDLSRTGTITKTTNTHQNLLKKDAISIINKHYNELLKNPTIHFANINSKKHVWWFDIPVKKFTSGKFKTINLLAFDNEEGLLHHLIVNTNQIKDNLGIVYILEDKESVSLELSAKKHNKFQDVRPGGERMNFSQFLVKTIRFNNKE